MKFATVAGLCQDLKGDQKGLSNLNKDGKTPTIIPSIYFLSELETCYKP